MSNNFLITQGTGTTVATEQGTGSEHYQKIKLIDPTIGATAGIGTAANPIKIDPTGATPQPVTGTFWPATQPVSIATMPSTPVTGTFFQATQPVSIATMPSTPVTGTFFQATQPISGTITANAGTGSFTVAQATASNLNATVTVANPVIVQSALLCISTTAATGVAVTATLPAVASQFHYITLIEVVKYFTAANAASATPLVITTTNLPGSLAFTLGQPLGTIGTTDRILFNPNSPLHSSVVNTATTIVCPATTGIIWRVNVFYFAAP